MKLSYLFFLVTLLFCFGCKNQSIENASALIPENLPGKVFQDQNISTELSFVEIKEKEVIVKMIIKNKTNYRLSFNSTDFIFKNNDQFGLLPKGRIIADLMDGSIRKEIEEPEGENRAKEMMQAYMKRLTKYHDNIFSKVTLEGGDKVIKEFVITFNNKVDVKQFEYFFNGKYSKLINI